MKTHEISLKKKILLVELPKEKEIINLKDWYIDDLGNFRQSVIEFDEDYWNRREDYIKVPKDLIVLIPKLKFIGKPEGLQDSDVEDLVEKVMQGQHYQNYKARKENDAENLWCKSALESFMSALEAEVYLENPYGKEPEVVKTINITYSPNVKEWHEAESRTFDKSRTLIFVKNEDVRKKPYN